MSYNYYTENLGEPRSDLEAKQLGRNLRPNVAHPSPKGVNSKEINLNAHHLPGSYGSDWNSDGPQDLLHRREQVPPYMNNTAFNPSQIKNNSGFASSNVNPQAAFGSAFGAPGMFQPGGLPSMMGGGMGMFDMSNPMMMMVMNFYETHLNQMKALLVQKANEISSYERRLYETNEKLQFLEEHLKNFSTKCESASDESMRKYLNCLEELNVYKQREKLHQEKKLDDLNKFEEEQSKLMSQMKALRDKNSFNEEKIFELESALAEQVQKYNALNRVNENLTRDLSYYKTSFQSLEKTHNDFLNTKNSVNLGRSRTFDNMKNSSSDLAGQSSQLERPGSPKGRERPLAGKAVELESSEDVQYQKEKNLARIPKEFNSLKENRNNVSTVKSLLAWEEEGSKSQASQPRRVWARGESTPEKGMKQYESNNTNSYEEDILNFFNQKEMAQSSVYGAQSNVHGAQSNAYGAQSNVHGAQSNAYGAQSNVHGVQSNAYGPQSDAVETRGRHKGTNSLNAADEPENRREEYKATGINILPSERRFENNREDIKRLEAELLQFNQEKNKIESEILKLPLAISTASHRRRKLDLESAIDEIEQKISKTRNQLRLYDKNFAGN